MKKMALKAELAPSHEPRSSTNFQPRRFDSNGTYSNFNERNTRFDSNPVSPNFSRFDSNRGYSTFRSNNADTNQKSSNFEPLQDRFSSNNPGKSSNEKNECSLCDGDHWQGNCDKFITPAEKLKQLRLKNYCTKCSRNHDTKNCFSKIVCRSCDGDHYAFLCKEGSNRSTAFINVEKKKGMLLTKDVTIINPVTKETTETVVIFDSGSQQSYVSNRIIEQLNLEIIGEEKHNVVGFGAKASSYTSSLVKFKIKTEECYKEVCANSTKCIATTVPVISATNSDSDDVKIEYKTPEILIGMDYFLEFINSFEKTGNNTYVVNSIVGQMICKNSPKYQKTTVASLVVEQSQNLIEDNKDLQKFWNLEKLGIKDKAEKEDERIILEKFEKNVKFPELPTNAGLALGRLRSTNKRLSIDPVLFNECEKITDDQKTRGISFKQLKAENSWWKSSQFLKQEREHWPKSPELGTDLAPTLTAIIEAKEISDLQNIELKRDIEIDLKLPHSKEPIVIRPIDFISPGIKIELPTVSVDNENDDATFLPPGNGGGERLFEQFKETLQKELKETRQAESILRKELKITKKLFEQMLEDYNKVVIEKMDKPTGRKPYIEISKKLIQLSTNITQALKTRSELLVQLADVKKENQKIRNAVKELSK
uniref:Peptidase aspartic putative domain-containing protein n=1 Tax=Panagrolaimus superbus TaxID=310955 RepID=A0A914XUL9_9BILA